MNDFFTKHRLDKFCLAMDDNIYIAALRRGLSLSIPFFLVGSLALVLINLPIPGYQEYLAGVWGGKLLSMFFIMFYATMGVLALVLIASVGFSFGQLADPSHMGFYPITCLVCFLAFVLEINNGAPGSGDGTLAFSMFDSNWMFTAVLITLSCCSMLRFFLAASQNWHNRHYHEGVDLDFRNVIVSITPIALCIIVVILARILLTKILGSVDLQNIGSVMFTALFEKVGMGFGGSLLFIFLIHILWFFGIHGSNMLNMVSIDMFEKGMAVNMAAVAAGEKATVLFTKTFFDSFILMGGSGATVCLLLALLIGSKRSSAKSLFRFSVIPSIFNINELVLFGLPVVFNPIMLIPFLLVPLVLLCTSSAAMAIGLVPICAHEVTWTTPIFFSGWQATGSLAGAVLQMVNLGIGTLIYLPFIKVSEQYYSDLLQQNVDKLRDTIIEREETGDTSSLHAPAYQNLNDVIKQMTADLHHALDSRKISMFYQPQFSYDGTLYGVEALLRWNHPTLGYQYPPLVIELAREEGLLQRMGYQIIETSACALERLSKEVNYPIDMAVNISPVQLEDPHFCDKVQELLKKHDFGACTLCFEITEQIALGSTAVIHDRIARLHDMGILFHMDDFGMGHSSMLYLQNNDFSAVKLDGSLVRGIEKNQRAQEIISGIQRMSSSLNYDLIAEFVETEEQKKVLHDLGCDIYQGYYYSPALRLPELETYLKNNNVIAHVSRQRHTDFELYL